MSQPQPLSRFTVKEGSGIVVLSRVVDWQGVKVAKAAVSSLTYYAYDLGTSLSQPTLKASGSITVATSWSDTYLTAGWTADATGYNAYCPIPGSVFLFPLTTVKGNKIQLEIIGSISGSNVVVADMVIDVNDMLSQGS